MKKNSKLLFSLSICTCFALNTMAEEKTDLGEVSIIDTALEAQIKSITSEKLENLQASDIKDILKSMPSVIVDGNARYSQKVYIRGLEDKSSNITIDGAKISGQLFHHSGDQTIDAEMLKIGSIELGPNSALSGPGVINGSFIYETKDPSDYLKEGENFGGKVSVGYQSGFDRKSLDVAIFSKINEKLEFVGIGNLSKDGELSIPNSDNIKSKESKLKSGLVKVIFKPNDENTFKLSYNKYQDGGNRQLSGEKAGSSLSSNDRHNEISRDTYTLNYNYSPQNDLVNIDAKLYSSKQDLEIEGDSGPAYWLWQRGFSHESDEPTMNFENETKGIDLRNTSLLSNHKLTYGISFDKEKQAAKAGGKARYTNGPRAGEIVDLNVAGGETKEYALYVEDEIELDKLLLTIGARYDIHKLGGLYSEKNKQLSPKLKAEYQLTDNLKLRAGYGRIFKGPVLSETMLVSDITTNPFNINAQTGHNYELGFDYDLTNALDADEAIFGFTAYTYNVDNFMHPTKNIYLRSQYDTKIWGLESVFRYQKDALTLSLSHTYTGGESESIENGIKFDPTTTKIHTFKADVDYKISKELFVNYNAEFVPGNKINSYWEHPTTGRGPDEYDVERSGYGVHNISATYAPSSIKGAKFHFAVDNIFDKKYARHTAFGTDWGNPERGGFEVGRNFKIKFSYRF